MMTIRRFRRALSPQHCKTDHKSSKTHTLTSPSGWHRLTRYANQKDDVMCLFIVLFLLHTYRPEQHSSLQHRLQVPSQQLVLVSKSLLV